MRRLLLVPMALLAGCGGGPADTRDAATTPARTATTTRASAPTPRPAALPRLRDARCGGSDSANCTAATGIVLTIESLDPDGDGDLHVIATGGSVTAPGITVFDVSKAIRPRRDPRPGDRVTGAGPVYRGSHGQRQIQVTVFRVARARR